MNYIELFKNASEQTQHIILGFNILLMLYIGFTKKIANKIALYGILILIIGIAYYTIHHLSHIPFKLFFTVYCLSGILLGVLLAIMVKIVITILPKKELTGFDIEIPRSNGKPVHVNIVRGVSVQGAAGSGKTVSVAGWLLKSLGERSISGIVYDYKDFELTEVVMWFYRNASIPVKIFAPADPSRSVQINPIAPEILKTQEDIILMAKTIVNNVVKGDMTKGDDFFVQAAEGAITGAIIKLKEDHPQYCSFPYLSAIFLTKTSEELVAFITSNENASRQSRAFIDGQDSEKQMAAVKATLSNAFKIFDIPSIFYTMERSSVSLAVNDKKSQSVLCLVNKPKYADVYGPIFSIIAQATILEMSQRDREPSYLLFDEAPTLKVHKIERVPATMRSFGIATIYMLQDIVQATNQIGRDRMKEVFSNLSTYFFGKTNDPDTAKFFEAYFEEHKIKQKSISKKGGSIFAGSGDMRITTSEKDEKTHKSYEMFKRATGSFFVFDSNGTSYDAKIKKPHIEPVEIKKSNSVTDWEVQRSYDSILRMAAKL